jgi:hypothetical protein
MDRAFTRQPRVPSVCELTQIEAYRYIYPNSGLGKSFTVLLNNGYCTGKLTASVVRVPGYRSKSSEKKWVWNGVHSSS